VPPGKKPLEVLSKGELSDPHPDFVGRKTDKGDVVK
jgi:hypothetical protein